ncbi:MAG: GTP-binding protein Era, partial [uncultured Acidimicrobiales bacterium]
ERRPRGADAGRAAHDAGRAGGARGRPRRLRDLRGPPQRREVHVAQPHPRPEGEHRLRQAPDHPQPGAGRAEPAGRPGRVRGHPRHPQAEDDPRHPVERDGHRGGHRGRRRVPGRGRDHAPRQGRPVRRRTGAEGLRGGRQQDRRGPARRGAAPADEGGVARPERVLPGVGGHRRRGGRPGRAPRGPAAHRPAAVPAGRRDRRPRGVLGGRARPRAALRRDAGGDAVLDRHPGHRLGVALDPLRDPRRAGVAEGDGDRPARRRPQGGGHRRAGPAGGGRLPGARGQGRPRVAAPSPLPAAPRVL